MPQIKGYVTDLDGTLCDTRTANIAAYKHAFKDTNLEFNTDKYESAFGLRFDKMMDVVAPASTDEQRKNVQQLKKIHYANSFDLVTINDGLVALLTQLKHDGKKLGLATTAQSVNGQKVLRYFGLESLFDQILYGDDVQNGKPDPECYTKIISRLELEPFECLIFEDSETGIQAARAAGASVLKVVL